jgi:hypothetical protein
VQDEIIFITFLNLGSRIKKKFYFCIRIEREKTKARRGKAGAGGFLS